MDNNNNEYFEVAPGVWGMKIIFVNVYMIAEGDHWVLVDAALMGSAGRIIKMAESLFGDKPPAAIVLTHGHFDHRGAIDALLDKWQVPVYAHEMELPYLQGKSAYPPPDPTVGGGLMTLMSVLYPKRPINLGNKITKLPADGSVPFLPDWLSVFTPGHSPGHISLFRGGDKVLIAGDAFVTTKQESAVATLTSLKKLCGPPRYFTPDWTAAKTSVKTLRDLQPAIAATGHGMPMQGAELSEGLNHLVDNFDELAVPSVGRYVGKPAKTNRRGVQFVPPYKLGTCLAIAALAVTAIAAFALIRKAKA
jgi:glyoxylase-like metal-dependent hydrolase (beta-lactamase superfamily II)